MAISCIREEDAPQLFAPCQRWIPSPKCFSARRTAHYLWPLGPWPPFLYSSSPLYSVSIASQYATCQAPTILHLSHASLDVVERQVAYGVSQIVPIHCAICCQQSLRYGYRKSTIRICACVTVVAATMTLASLSPGRAGICTDYVSHFSSTN